MMTAADRTTTLGWAGWAAAAAVLLVVAALAMAYPRLAGRRLAGVAGAAAAGSALLAHGVDVLARQPGRAAALWLGAGAALLGAGLSMLDRGDNFRDAVATFGGAAGLLAGAITVLVTGIVILASGGDGAGPAGAAAIGCAVTAFVMAVVALYGEGQPADLLLGWNAGGSLGIGVGLVVLGCYEGLHGTPAAWFALVPGVGFVLAPLPLLDDLL